MVSRTLQNGHVDETNALHFHTKLFVATAQWSILHLRSPDLL